MTDTYACEIDIAADASRVWAALTDPDELEAWFCEHADVDLGAGRYDFWGRYTPGNPSRVAHPVDQAEAGSLLRYRFPYLGATTTVSITLAGIEGGTRVHVLHSGVPARTDGGGHHPRHLWANALTHLRAHVETGRPGPRFDYTWPHLGGFATEAATTAAAADVHREIVHQWDTLPNRRPARNDDEDFCADFGFIEGIKILDLTEPTSYSLDCLTSGTVLTYTLDESGGRTRITLACSGFAEDTDAGGVAEGYFSGLVHAIWKAETSGTWPPAVTPMKTPWPQSMWQFGVRVLQSTP